MHDYEIICNNIEKVAKESNCANQGVAITVLYDPEYGYSYYIWSVSKSKIIEQRLLASATPYERLLAHATGFCQNCSALLV